MNDEEKPLTAFGERLLEAFGTENKSEIARLMETSPSSISKYTTTEILPRGEFLLKVLELRKATDLHYLLTGVRLAGREAAKHEENPYGLTPAQLLFVQMLADSREAGFNEVMKEVVYDGLDERARRLSLTYKTMERGQLEDVLNAVLAAPPANDNGADEETAPRSPRRDARARR